MPIRAFDIFDDLKLKSTMGEDREGEKTERVTAIERNNKRARQRERNGDEK